MAPSIFMRLCALMSVTVASCTVRSYEYCDEHTVAYHEGGHAVYGIVTGLCPAAILVTRNDEYIRCPGDEDASKKQCGVVCFDSVYGIGSAALWDSCALYEAGQFGVSVALGFEEQARCHSTDDEFATKNVSAIIDARNRGEPWLPGWPTDWREDDRPDSGSLMAECRRHTLETLQANHAFLKQLGRDLESDPDGQIIGEEVSDNYCH